MNREIRGSDVRQVMMKEVAERGDHMGAAMIGCAVLGLGEAVSAAGSKVAGAIDRQTHELGRQWGYDKPRIR